MGIIGVFLGGGFGSLLRFLLSKWIVFHCMDKLPWATLITNLLATGILGYGVFYLFKGDQDSLMYKFMIIGFCGGFSTFSTFSMETFTLLKSGHIFFAVANVLLSIAMSLLILYRLNS